MDSDWDEIIKNESSLYPISFFMPAGGHFGVRDLPLNVNLYLGSHLNEA